MKDTETELDKEMLLSTADSSVLSAQEVAARLQVDVRAGLRWSEANSRSKIVGYNELNALDDEPTWLKYVQQFKNPLILLLLGKEMDDGGRGRSCDERRSDAILWLLQDRPL